MSRQVKRKYINKYLLRINKSEIENQCLKKELLTKEETIKISENLSRQLKVELKDKILEVEKLKEKIRVLNAENYTLKSKKGFLKKLFVG